MRITAKNWNQSKQLVNNCEPLAAHINATLITFKQNAHIRFLETLRDGVEFNFDDIISHSKKTT